MIKILRNLKILYFIKSVISPISKLEKNIIRNNIVKYFIFCSKEKKKYKIISSFPSSGWNYFNSVVNKYLNLKQKTKEKSFFLTINGKACLNNNLENFSLMNTHYCYFEIPFILNGTITDNKKVIISRNYISALYSYYKKYNRKMSFEKFIYNGRTLDRIVDYYNSWGKHLLKNRKFKIVKYENLRRNPVHEFSKVLIFLRKERTDIKNLKIAIKHRNFHKLKKLKIKSGKKNIDMFMGKLDYTKQIDPQTLKYIKNYLLLNLDHEVKKLFKYKI